MPVLSAKQLEDVISSPVESQTIEELAKGKKDVAIIFDDMSRGTPCEDIAKIIRYILNFVQFIHRGGGRVCALRVEDNSIFFIESFKQFLFKE